MEDISTKVDPSRPQTAILRCPIDPSEWVLVELQGVFVAKGNNSLPGLEIGKLTVKNDKVYLRVANNELEGKLITLPKPLAVLHKDEDAMVVESADSVNWKVQAVVRQKYLFATRPKNVLS